MFSFSKMIQTNQTLTTKSWTNDCPVINASHSPIIASSLMNISGQGAQVTVGRLERTDAGDARPYTFDH